MSGCRVITVANARGGAGKTFLSIHLSYVLAEKGKRVLLIDTDPQERLAYGWVSLIFQTTPGPR